MAISVTDCNIDVLACEVDVMHGGQHSKVDLGMDLGKSPKPMDEPLSGEIRRGTHREHARTLTLHQTLCAVGDVVKGVAHDPQIFPAGIGDSQSLLFSVEELDAEFRLQRFDLVAHCPLCDGKLLGGASEAHMPSSGLKSP